MSSESESESDLDYPPITWPLDSHSFTPKVGQSVQSSGIDRFFEPTSPARPTILNSSFDVIRLCLISDRLRHRNRSSDLQLFIDLTVIEKISVNPGPMVGPNRPKAHTARTGMSFALGRITSPREAHYRWKYGTSDAVA